MTEAVPLRLEGVMKRFGALEALRGIDLAVERGEVVALLGPNGAGKTTAVSILLGLRRADAGRALLFGRDPHAPAARMRVGVTPQEIAFPWTLRVGDVVDLVRAHFPAARAREQLVRDFGLERVAQRQTGGLSGGQRRRLAAALAFAGDPRALVLDELTAGLDVEARRQIWSHVRTFAGDGGAVLLTTHHLDEAEALASRVVVLVDGRVVAAGPLDEIRRRTGLAQVRFTSNEPPPMSPEIVRAERDGAAHTLYTRDPDAVVRALVHSRREFSNLHVTTLTLEDAFLALLEEQRCE